MATPKIVFKDVDVVFLLSITLVLQGTIQLKLLGVLFFLFFRFNGLKTLSGFSRFYFFMIIFHVIHGLFNLFFRGVDYLTPFLLVLIFLLIASIINAQLVFFFKKKNAEIQRKTIETLFLLFVLVVFGQYVYTAITLGSINPYGVTQAAGDRMKSIFANSSVSMIVMSFFFFFFFQYKKWIFCLLSLTCLLMAAYMSGTVLFLAASLLSLLLFSNMKFRNKLYFVFLTCIFAFLLVSTSPENIRYAMGYINRIIENDASNLPFKIRSFWQTISYWFSSVQTFVFGAGGGNFSSRAAFIVSGDYVAWFPDSATYVSEEFANNHFAIWTYDFNNPWDNRNNTANQPFSFYNRIVGEHGVLGIIGFCMLYLGYMFRNWKRLSFSKYMLIALGGYFLLDYWFEYFTVIVVFELLVLYDLHNTVKQKRK